MEVEHIPSHASTTSVVGTAKRDSIALSRVQSAAICSYYYCQTGILQDKPPSKSSWCGHGNIFF
jgi:hypothetical protein